MVPNFEGHEVSTTNLSLDNKIAQFRTLDIKVLAHFHKQIIYPTIRHLEHIVVAVKETSYKLYLNPPHNSITRSCHQRTWASLASGPWAAV